MNVIDAPAQVGLDPDVTAIDTDGATDPVNVIVIAVEVAVVGLAQPRLEVITQVTICPVVSVEVV